MEGNEEIDYARDWSGEVRLDPDTDNAFVLRSIDRTFDGWTVTINDILGGHRWILSLEEWTTWKRVMYDHEHR